MSAPYVLATLLAGVLAAEVTQTRPVGERRAASLVRRDLGQYLSRRVVLAQRASAIAGAVGLLVAGVLPYPPATSSPGAAGFAAGAGFILAFAAGVEAMERWLVRRPQPFTNVDLVATDDAIRAQSVQAFAGAALSLLLLFCCGVALGLQASDVDALQVAMVPVAVVLLGGSLAVVRDIGEGAWRVRRPGAVSA